MHAPAGRDENHLLSAFPPNVLIRLRDQLEPVVLGRRMVILEAGVNTSHIYFPGRGMVSLVKTMLDGRTAEVAAIGREGMVGVPALLGVNPPVIEGVVQVEGTAQRIEVPALRTEVERSHALKELVLRYMNYRISQLAQTAACNRLHSLRQRCCRWLLTVDDSAQTDSFTLTHEFLAMMMGVNRPALSTTLQGLRRAGVIEYHYASVRILNRPALEEGACECLQMLRDEAGQVYRS